MTDEERIEDEERQDEEIAHIPIEITDVEQEDIWGAPQYYANYVEIHTSGSDFRLSFYVRGPRSREGGTSVEYRKALVAVRLPRDMLGSVRRIIDSQIEQIEERTEEEEEGEKS